MCRASLSTAISIFPVTELVSSSEKVGVYDSLDADVVQSYMEYSLASLVYYCMKEGATSEQSSRMSAMDNSSKNAGQYFVFQGELQIQMYACLCSR